MEQEFRFLLVSADDNHSISVKKFKTEAEAHDQMVAEVREVLLSSGYDEDECDEALEKWMYG